MVVGSDANADAERFRPRTLKPGGDPHLQSLSNDPWDGCAPFGTAFGTDTHLQNPQCLPALGRMGRISSG